jgi:aspartate kinase
MADPKIIDNPKRIKTINYEELRELSYMGASVLHEETILPLFDTNIPIEILNTNKPDEEGTIITKTANDNSSLITGIAGKKNYLSITVGKERQADKLKVMSSVLNILDKYNVIIEHLPTSIDSFSAIVLADSVSERIFEIIKEVKGIEGVTDVSIDDDIALIAVVGRNMVTKTGISGKIFGTVGLANINIKMITQGAKELTIIMGVANKDFEKAIRVIYDNVN